MHIEIDPSKLYPRTFHDSVGKRIVNLCCNCFLNECLDQGCIRSTNDGLCQCELNHLC